jgi:hypothetical protein
MQFQRIVVWQILLPDRAYDHGSADIPLTTCINKPAHQIEKSTLHDMMVS